MTQPVDLRELAARMDELVQRSKDTPRVERFTRADFNPYPEGSEGWQRYQQEREVIRAAEQSHADLNRELEAFVEELCKIYLASDVAGQVTIRQFVAERRSIWEQIFYYIRKATQQISSSRDSQWLRLALAALSIEDDRLDIRDTSLALDRIFFTAELAGIDPRPYFLEVALMSNDTTPRSGYSPMAQMLRRAAHRQPNERGTLSADEKTEVELRISQNRDVNSQ